MATDTKYFYMRLKEDFFDSESMILLESLPDGLIYQNILLKMYCRSLKNEGRLMFNNIIPYNSEMIAKITRQQVGTVEKALTIFQQMGLIDILDNGAIYMMDIQRYIGKSSTEADRQREYYKKIAEEKTEISCKKSYKNSTPYIDIDIKKEIETEIETKDVANATDVDVKRSKKNDDIETLITQYTNNPDLREALFEYVKMRKSIKKPMTAYALKRAMYKLDDIGDSDDIKIAMLGKSIEHCWQSVYALNAQEISAVQKKQEQEKFDNLTEDEREEMYKHGLSF